MAGWSGRVTTPSGFTLPPPVIVQASRVSEMPESPWVSETVVAPGNLPPPNRTWKAGWLGASTITCTVFLRLGSARLVTAIVLVPGTDGAVKKPSASSWPAPLRLQATAWFPRLLRGALNSWEPPTARCRGPLGVMKISGVPATTWMAAVAWFSPRRAVTW